MPDIAAPVQVEAPLRVVRAQVRRMKGAEEQDERAESDDGKLSLDFRESHSESQQLRNRRRAETPRVQLLPDILRRDVAIEVDESGNQFLLALPNNREVLGGDVGIHMVEFAGVWIVPYPYPLLGAKRSNATSTFISPPSRLLVVR